MARGYCAYQTFYDHIQNRGVRSLHGVTLNNFEDYYDMVINHPSNDEISPTLRNVFRNEGVFYQDRRPFIQVSRLMSLALLNTNIDIPAEQLHCPFPVFEIQLWPKALPLTALTTVPEGLNLTDKFAADEIFICSILVSCNLHAPSFHHSCGMTLGFIHLTLQLDFPGATANDKIFHVGFPLIVDTTLEQSIDLYWQGTPTSTIETIANYELTANISPLVVGTIFLAINRNRDYVQRTKTIYRNRDFCFCGSGLRYRNCCQNRREQVGYEVGRDIELPTETQPGHSVVVEGRGQELTHAHIRSGHMAWQWRNDEEGNRIRTLIFRRPTIVRPDLPMKPQLTPRIIRGRRPNPHRIYNVGHPNAGDHQLNIGYEYIAGELSRSDMTAIDSAIAGEMYYLCQTYGFNCDGWSDERTVNRYIKFHFNNADDLADAYNAIQTVDWLDVIENSIPAARRNQIISAYVPSRIRARNRQEPGISKQIW